MIEVEKSDELLTLRVRPRMPKTIDEEQGPRNHHQQGWQIHLAEEEICPKNRSHLTEILEKFFGGFLGVRNVPGKRCQSTLHAKLSATQ